LIERFRESMGGSHGCLWGDVRIAAILSGEKWDGK
jgi:hypothetical protein